MGESGMSRIIAAEMQEKDNEGGPPMTAGMIERMYLGSDRITKKQKKELDESVSRANSETAKAKSFLDLNTYNRKKSK